MTHTRTIELATRRRAHAGASRGAPVPFVALDRQHAPLQPELDATFRRVVGAGSFVLGEEVERFEGEFAAYCGVADCVGVSSGTAAIALALRAAGIGAGDEVVVPAHTYIASALGVLHAGGVPVFCEVDADTGLMDPAAAAAAVTRRTAALLPVHLYGQVCDIEALRALAQRAGLAIFEDAAQAHGATRGGRRAGSLGTAAAFSFYPSKNLGALGDGGAICTADPELARRARELRNLGQRAKGEHVVVGFNERLHGLQAALLRVKLPHLDEWNQARRGHAATYREGLEGRVRLLGSAAEDGCVYHLFPIRVANRSRVMSRLAAEGVQTAVHYTPAVPDQPPFADRAAGSGFRHARAWAAEELSLPMFAELEPFEAEHVVEAMTAALEEVDAA